jgi:hypothetical protein
MTLRRLGFVLGFVFLLFPAAVRADEHRAGIFGGFSYMEASNLWGFHTTGEVVPYHYGPNSRFKFFPVIADFSLHNGTHEGADLTVKTGLFGVGARKVVGQKQVIAAQLMFGWVSGAGSNGTTSFGTLYEYLPRRTEMGWHWGVRVQYDYLNRSGDQNFHRASIGVVFRDKTK